VFEIALGIALCVAMGKLASADGRNGVLWGLITFVLCAASLLIPIPFFRMIIAAVVVFIAMIAAKVIAK